MCIKVNVININGTQYIISCHVILLYFSLLEDDTRTQKTHVFLLISPYLD